MLESEGLCATEVLQSAPQGAVCREVHLKCFYANTHRMRNKTDKLEVLAQSYSSYIIGISKTWWDESCGCWAAIDGYRLFRRDRQGRRDGWVAMYVEDGLDCVELQVGDGKVESLWVKIKG